MGIPLGPKYILYFYMEPLGRVEGLGLKGLPGPSKAVPSVILYVFFIRTPKKLLGFINLKAQGVRVQVWHCWVKVGSHVYSHLEVS